MEHYHVRKKNSDAFKDFFYICYKGPPHLNIAFIEN